MNEAPFERPAWLYEGFDKCRDSIVRTAYSILGDMEQAQECAQRTFLTALKKANEFDPSTDLCAWLRAIARYKALEMLRENLRTVTIEPEDVDRPGPDDAARWIQHLAMLQCIERLDPVDRQIVFLRATGSTDEMIAQQVGLSRRAVADRREKISNQIKVCMGDAQAFEGSAN